jgi:hypothetical protein
MSIRVRVSPPSGHRIGANSPSPHSSDAPRAIQVSSGPLRLVPFSRLRARHLRDVITGARHPPGDLEILVLLHALLIPQGAPAAFHTPALDVAYITDDHEPPDAHPALVLAVVSSLYMLYAELAFRSGYASSYPHIVSHANPAFFPAMLRTIHAFSAAPCTSATPTTRSSVPEILAVCPPPAQGALGLRYGHYALVTAHRCLPCAPVTVFCLLPSLCALHHTPPSFLPRGWAVSSSLPPCPLPLLPPERTPPTILLAQGALLRPQYAAPDLLAVPGGLLASPHPHPHPHTITHSRNRTPYLSVSAPPPSRRFPSLLARTVPAILHLHPPRLGRLQNYRAIERGSFHEATQACARRHVPCGRLRHAGRTPRAHAHRCGVPARTHPALICVRLSLPILISSWY